MVTLIRKTDAKRHAKAGAKRSRTFLSDRIRWPFSSGSGGRKNLIFRLVMATPPYELPQATVVKIAKKSLPEDAQIGKEAKVTFARAAGLFVLYLAHTANDIAKTAKRSTISAKDVLEAVEEIEFDEFLDPLEKCLRAYQKEHEKGDKESKAGSAKGEKASGSKKRSSPSGKGGQVGSNKNSVSTPAVKRSKLIDDDHASDHEDGPTGSGAGATTAPPPTSSLDSIPKKASILD
eukprot:g70852.t1